MNLDRFEEKPIELFCIPKKPGQLIIRGLEIGLFKMALFNHSFYEKTPNELYKQKDNYIIAKPNNITYDVTDEKQDISIKFSNKNFTLFKNELSFLKINIQNNSNAKLKRYSVFLDDNDHDLHIKVESKSNSGSGSHNKRSSKNLHSASFGSHSNMGGLDNISQQHLNFYHEEKPIIGNVSVFKYFHREVDIFKSVSNDVNIISVFIFYFFFYFKFKIQFRLRFRFALNMKENSNLKFSLNSKKNRSSKRLKFEDSY